MGKTTDENYRKLENAKKYGDAQLDGMIDHGFGEALNKLMDEKGVTTRQLVDNTGLSKTYINELRSFANNAKNPTRGVVINIAIGLNATVDEANLLLKRARYSELYTRDKAESMIIWGMLKKLDGEKIREMLFDGGFGDILETKNGK